MTSRLERHGPLFLLTIAGVVALALSWGSATRLDTIVFISATGIIATSLALVYGHAGILSVAQAGFAAIGGYATAIVTVRYDWPVLLGLVLAVGIPALFAYILARLIVRLSHLALAVATLLVSEVLTHLLRAGGEFTGGHLGIAGIPRWGPMSTGRGAAVTGVVLVILVTFVLLRVSRSQQGRALRVIAVDQVLASSLGIDITKRMSAVFSLAAGMAGVGGWYFAHTRRFMAPDALPISLSLTVIFMVIVGGKSTILGPILGTTLLVLISDAAPSAAVRGMFYGGALIVVLVAFPNGLLGTDWRRVRHLFTRRGRAAADESSSSGQVPSPDPVTDASRHVPDRGGV